jgi:large subunit ribosomal protein L18
MRVKRKKRIYGTTDKPRLVVFRSLKYIYGQIIDDTNHKVLASISNLSKSADASVKKAKSKTEASKLLGKKLGEIAVKNKIENIVFDRNGYLYHGRIKAFAEGAREGGLKF